MERLFLTRAAVAVLSLFLGAGGLFAQCVSVEVDEFPAPKRVGIEPVNVGQDTLLIDFDLSPEGTPLQPGTVIDTVFQSVGVRFSAILTRGPEAGSLVNAQALLYTDAPAAISLPNILSGTNPALGPNASGEIAGTATIVATFVSPDGTPTKVSMAGAKTDLAFETNTLTAFSGPDATGQVLGTVSASGPGDFFGIKCPGGIGSISFSGASTEVDDLIYAPPLGPPYQVQAVQTAPGALVLRVNHEVAIKGGEVGISYDPAKVAPLRVSPGEDLPAGATLYMKHDGAQNCSSEASVAAGLIVGWINSNEAQALTPPGQHDLVRVHFRLAEGAESGACSTIRFVDCLGPAVAPVRNIVTTAGGGSIALTTHESQFCRNADPAFRRGDSNEDGNFDISDGITMLACLFLGDNCRACVDASDVNDDGLVNIADPIYFFGWRFLDGLEPSAPFPACGNDPSPSGLNPCESFAACP